MPHDPATRARLFAAFSAERLAGSRTLPRYYFDIRDGKNVHDDEGLVFKDLAAAKREALKTAGEILRDKEGFWDGELWTMQVRDEGGAIVATLTFSAS